MHHKVAFRFVVIFLFYLYLAQLCSKVNRMKIQSEIFQIWFGYQILFNYQSLTLESDMNK